MSEGTPSDAAVAMAFDLIRSAATMLSMFPYKDAVDSLQRQADIAWYLNPTIMLSRANREDMDRKIRLLRAAATFIAEWDAVEAETLAEATTEAPVA